MTLINMSISRHCTMNFSQSVFQNSLLERQLMFQCIWNLSGFSVWSIPLSRLILWQKVPRTKLINQPFYLQPRRWPYRRIWYCMESSHMELLSYINNSFLTRVPLVRKKHYLVQQCGLFPRGLSLLNQTRHPIVGSDAATLCNPLVSYK